MAGGGGNGEEADYWPGYVDALTAMVKVLAFVMMLLAVAVFVLSQNVSRQIVQQLAEAANVEPKEGQSVEQITQDIIRTLEQRKQTPPPPPPQTAMEKVPDRRIESTATESYVQQTPVQAVASGARLVVTFPDRVTRIDPEAITRISEFVRPMAGSGRRFVVLSHADVNGAALTEARRIAYFRGMQLRGQVIAGGFPADAITVQVVDSTDAEKGRTAEIVAQ
jgi:hypothetical protein